MAMKEIKFRVWHSKKEKWLWGPGMEVSLFGEMIIFGEFLRGHSLEEINHIEALQFTGLKDRNGKDIYDGDILTHGNGYRFYVESCPGGFQVILPKQKETMSIGFISESHCTVMGNIHDNPELLK